jgi:flagellar biosynthesis/type III secretory pathway M-ring protein FliF/YscJ
MSWFPRPSRPSVAFADLRAFMRQRSREQRIGAALSILVTLIIVIVFFVDSKINTAPPPYIVYVESWPENRTEAEIVADQKRDQAEAEAFRKERQKQFQELENKLGM